MGVVIGGKKRVRSFSYYIYTLIIIINDSGHQLRFYYVLGTILNTLYALIHLILAITRKGELLLCPVHRSGN